MKPSLPELKHEMKCGNLVEICFWLNLAVKRLRLAPHYNDLPWALSIKEKNPEISVGAKVEFPIVKKLLHLAVNPGTSRCSTVDLELVQTTRNV